ncbi:cold-responsive protein kinase 1-like [Oryza brachyantha]|uniref:cold-responsive protein kinase 1-like n=1 Tax=Oryza brachyantha TaxID=4533 RepID=UPI0003EA983D|nr:cold-responsive protein kinase 1-like [Oryza brachyantha]
MALMKRCFCGSEEDFKELLSLKNVQLFSYREIKVATNNFDHGNMLGRGGFGTVYKGTFQDGTAFAAKVLSVESEQGIKEFLTEIESITEAKHANLVSLLGCCVQRQKKILIYEYVENNSLDHALQGSAAGVTDLSWSTRSDICMGIAKGLSYLHEEHEPSIVHRDIKASNVLLDRNYSPKIGDFGVAKLFPDNVTHVSTRVVGTTGYLAPEYVVHGQLTKKADVYSFGVLVLEIISGRRISQTIRSDMFLVRQAWVLHEQRRLLDMVDANMKGGYPEEEALKFIKVALACTQATPCSRPTMQQVVRLLSRPVCFDELQMLPPGFVGDGDGDRP